MKRSKESAGRLARYEMLLPFLLYLVLSLIVTFPLIFKLRSSLLGRLGYVGDMEGTLWYHWFCIERLRQLGGPGYTDLFFYPWGKNLLLDTGGNFLDAYLSAPFQLIMGWPYSYNLLGIALPIFNGFCGYLLGMHLFRNRSAAMICGMVFAFNHYALLETKNGRLTQVLAGWIPLYVLYLFRTLEERRFRYPVLASVFFALTCFTYWFYGIFLIFFTALFLLYYGLFDRRWRMDLTFFARLAVMGICISVLILPTAWQPLLRMARGERLPGVSYGEDFPSMRAIESGEAPPRMCIILGSSWALGDLSGASGISGNFGFAGEGRSGVVLLPYLAAVGVVLFRRERPFFWLLGAFLFYILALGPYLHVGESVFYFMEEWAIPLPYVLLYKYVPFLSRLNFPERFGSIFFLCMGTLLGYASLQIFEWTRVKSSRQYIVVLGTVFLMMAEMALKHWYPLPVTAFRFPDDVPKFYLDLAGEKEGCIIDVPILTSHNAVIFQPVHRKPIFGGIGERAIYLLPGSYMDFIKKNSFLQALVRANDSPYLSLVFRKEDLEKLIRLDYRYLILHSDYCKELPANRNADVYALFEEALEDVFGAPIFLSDKITVFDLRKAKGVKR